MKGKVVYLYMEYNNWSAYPEASIFAKYKDAEKHMIERLKVCNSSLTEEDVKRESTGTDCFLEETCDDTTWTYYIESTIVE